MRYLFKTVLLSLRYKWTIFFSVVTALLIALLWGASISAVYPFVEVVFEGKTIHTWVEDGIARAESESDELRAQIAALRKESAKAPAGNRGALAGQITIREGQLAAHQKSREFLLSIRPAVERFGPATPYGTLVLVMGLLLLATAVKGMCLVLNVSLVAKVATATVTDMRRIFFREMLRMDQSTIDRRGVTQMMTMLSHNVGLVQAGLTALYGKSIREPLKIVACLAVACFISWPLLLVSMAIAPLGAYLIHYLAQRMKRAAGREMQGYTAIFQTLLDTLTGIQLVKIFSRQRKERRRFKENSRSLQRMTVNIAFYDALVRPVTELMAIVTLATAVLCGAYLVLNQQTHLFGLRMSARPLTAAELFAFFAMLAGIADPARKLSSIYNVLVRASLAGKALFTLFEQPPQITAPARPARAPTHQQSIRFEDVTFGYQPTAPVLKNLNLEIPFGQTMALVGVNGSGKSTVANLIARFYDPQAGNIYLDGVNLRHMRPRQLRNQIGIVRQSPLLFRGTLRMNICYADFRATEDQMRRAAQLAGVNSFIAELPNGFQTQVGDGGTLLSGGQRQRVALARAILSDPRILILDEATSQLDVETEQSLHGPLREFFKGRTTIVITHRPATLALAERIVVLGNGRIVEDVSISEIKCGLRGFADLLAKAA